MKDKRSKKKKGSWKARSWEAPWGGFWGASRELTLLRKSAASWGGFWRGPRDAIALVVEGVGARNSGNLGCAIFDDVGDFCTELRTAPTLWRLGMRNLY